METWDLSKYLIVTFVCMCVPQQSQKHTSCLNNQPCRKGYRVLKMMKMKRRVASWVRETFDWSCCCSHCSLMIGQCLFEILDPIHAIQAKHIKCNPKPAFSLYLYAHNLDMTFYCHQAFLLRHVESDHTCLMRLEYVL